MDDYKININEAYILNTFNQKDIKDWDLISKNVGKYFINDNPPLKYKRYPGFVFDNEIKAAAYYKYIFNNYIDMETPPRGNLTSSLKYVFIGYKPGTKDSELSKCESAWLFGPTANILDNLLTCFKIYPYFTNLAHERYADTFDLKNIMNEIAFIKYVINNNIVCVFLGKFREYEEVIKYTENNLGVKCIRIWHPAYIYRNGNSKELFEKWINKFKKEIEGK